LLHPTPAIWAVTLTSNSNSPPTGRGVRDFLPYASTFLIVRILGAGLGAAFAWVSFNQAGAEAFGLFSAIGTTVVIAGGTSGGWIGQSILRFGPQGHGGWWRLLLETRRGLAILASGSASSAAIASAVVLAGPSVVLTDLVLTAGLASIAVVVTALISIEIPRREAMFQPGAAGVVDLARVTALTLPPALASQFSSGSDVAIYSLALMSAIILLGYGLVLVTHDSEPVEESPARYDELRSRFWSYGWPLAMWVLLSGLYQFSDRLLLTWLASPEDAGRYSLLYDILNRGMVLPLMVIATATNPLVFNSYQQGDSARAARLNRLSTLAQAVAAALIAVPVVIGSIIAETRVEWFTSSELATALLVYLAGALWALASTTQRIQMGTGVSLPLLQRLAAFALLNAVLNLVLIPPLGMLGAAVATAFAAFGYLIAVGPLARDRRKGRPAL
jgi:O-antigen/teichoic acid export membrane protein